jgi:hypothetical protein
MPTPDQSDDFSHLPTIDEGQEEARQRKEALWSKHRRQQSEEDEARSSPPPAVSTELEPAAAHAAASHSDAWRDLLELEPEDPHYGAGSFEEPPPVPEEPPPPPPRIRVNKTVVRPLARPPETPSASAPMASPEGSSDPVAVEKQEEAVAKGSQELPKQEQAGRQDPKEKPVAEGKIRSNPKGKREPASVKGGEASGLDKEERSAADSEAEKPVDATAAIAAVEPKTFWQERWEKVGGLALVLSVGVHVFLIGIATYWVVSISGEPAVDFLSGGGTAQGQAASESLEHHVQQKKNPWLKKAVPRTRLATVNLSDVTLPDMQPDMLELPKASNLLAPATLGAGFGTAGAGGGMGSGIGRGGMSGVVFQPFSMFGRDIKAKRMAVILDVSTSMAPHLPRVVAEVDRVARGSVVILYFGCGLESPPPGGRLEGDQVFRTSGVEFERYWRLEGASLEDARKLKINPQNPIPSEDIFRMLARRPQTYFIHMLGVGYTWTALLSNEVRSADALYWFSDFADRVDIPQLRIVHENLKNRKQRLYIHAYERGSAFDLVKTQLVEPTGGDVIEE